MKNTRLYLFAAGLIAGCVTSFTTSAAESPALTEAPARPPCLPWTVGFEAGSEGIFGGFGSWRFSDHLGTRLAVDYTELSWQHLGIAGVHYNAKLRLLSEPLTLDVYPWQKRSFRVSIGVLFNQNELKGSAGDRETILLDGNRFSTVAVGSLNMKLEQQPVNPYISIGGNLFYFDQAHRWAMGGELGVAYTGSTKVSLYRSGAADTAIDSALHRAQDHLQRYGDQFTWWPVVKLNVSYSF